MSAEIESCTGKGNYEKSKKIIQLAAYCSTNDEIVASEMGQAALVSFIHDIPLKTRLWPSLPRLLSKEYFLQLKNEFIFATNENVFREMSKVYGANI